MIYCSKVLLSKWLIELVVVAILSLHTKFLHFEKCETDDFLGIWKSSKGGDESLVMEKIV